MYNPETELPEEAVDLAGGTMTVVSLSDQFSSAPLGMMTMESRSCLGKHGTKSELLPRKVRKCLSPVGCPREPHTSVQFTNKEPRP